MQTTRIISSPIGALAISATSRGVCSVYFREGVASEGDSAAAGHLDQLATELSEYFCGHRRAFTVPLDLVGTEFQRRVWTALLAIPAGETTSYGAIAKAIGNPSGSRAVGLANGSNPMSIVVPCHRVIGSSGRLVGYGGELWRKRWLLEHEGVADPKNLFATTPLVKSGSISTPSCTAAARYSLPC